MNRLVNDLRAALVSATNTPAPRRRRARRRNVNRNAAIPPVVSMPPAVPRRRRNRKKNTSSGTLATEGTLRLQKMELLTTVTSDGRGTVSSTVVLEPSSCPLLKSLIRSFERIRWHKIHILWKPAVGTTVGGLITYGVDWDQSAPATSRENIASYSPSATNAIWADTTARPMVLPSSRLMSRQWYTPQSGDQVDRAPGSLVYSANGPVSTVLGEFWIDYSVTLSGTKAG